MLDPRPISGVPAIRTDGNGGLMDVALHPQFERNRLVYLTYTKPVGNGMGAPALARGRLEAGALVDVRDLLVPDVTRATRVSTAVSSSDATARSTCPPAAGRKTTLRTLRRIPCSLRGKILRLNDDGSVPPDNPFVGRAGYRPEIYSWGIATRWASSSTPRPASSGNTKTAPTAATRSTSSCRGRDYGWPALSFGRDYPGPRVSEHPTREGMESPLVVWLPAIAVAGMAVYTGDQFPGVERQCVRRSHAPRAASPARATCSASCSTQDMEEMRRESMLREFRQRIREVREGPDGFLYLLTDDDDGALLRIEPAP